MTLFKRTDGWWADSFHMDEALPLGQGKPGGPRLETKLATSLCKKRELAVQAGAMVGMWPKYLSTKFETVVTCEPVPILFECVTRNLMDTTNVHMYKVALGDDVSVQRLLERRGGRSLVGDATGELTCAQVTLDSLELHACDALFLDVEGNEAKVLRGARETIKKFRPVIQVELLPRAKDEIRAMLRELGYSYYDKVAKADEVWIRA